MNTTFSVDGHVFDLVHAYRRHVVLAVADTPMAATSEALRGEFEEAKAALSQSTSTEDLVEEPLIAGWRHAFRAAGWNPSKFRSAAEALVRRALWGDLEPLGAALVDAGTIATLRHLVPMGVHVLDDVVASDLRLGPATGSETFELFDGSTESPDPGEIVYAAGPVCLTRRWAWRQGRVGSVFGAPTRLAVNVDVIDTSLVDEEVVLADARRLLEACGYAIQGTISLDASHPTGSAPGA